MLPGERIIHYVIIDQWRDQGQIMYVGVVIDVPLGPFEISICVGRERGVACRIVARLPR